MALGLSIFKASTLWANAFYKTICPYVCVCLFTFEVLFKCLFALTSWNWMSKISRDSESLGKSNEKRWSQIWKFLLIKGVKSPRQKKVCFGASFALLNRIFLVSVFLTPFNCLFSPTSQSPMSKLFIFSESLGKSNEKKWSQILQLSLIKDVKLPRQKKSFFTDFVSFVHR